MTQEHIITREMLIATLADVMKERDMARRSAQQTSEDYSTTLTANKKLRAENEKLASEITTLERTKALMSEEIMRLRNEISNLNKRLTDEKYHRDLEAARVDIDNASGSALRAIRDEDLRNEETQRKRLIELMTERNKLHETTMKQADEIGRLHAKRHELQEQNDALHKAHQLASQDLETARANIRDHERQIQRLTQKQCQCVPVLEQRLKDMTTDRDQLLSQLPEGMKTCKIRFTECENGHGMLTADNWAQHSCPWCKLNKLLELFEKNIHSCEMLMSNPPKNMIAYRGLEIIGRA